MTPKPSEGANRDGSDELMPWEVCTCEEDGTRVDGCPVHTEPGLSDEQVEEAARAGFDAHMARRRRAHAVTREWDDLSREERSGLCSDMDYALEQIGLR